MKFHDLLQSVFIIPSNLEVDICWANWSNESSSELKTVCYWHKNRLMAQWKSMKLRNKLRFIKKVWYALKMTFHVNGHLEESIPLHEIWNCHILCQHSLKKSPNFCFINLLNYAGWWAESSSSKSINEIREKIL